ncbi:hypothetical protein Hanom_Chr07g00675631 [Helianthus anomalus]
MKVDASFATADMANTLKSLFGEGNEPKFCRKAQPYVQTRVNFRFAPCGLVTLTVLLQTFKNSHFTP